jgi:cephalosporin-C deacetylase-like acetyl esterase
VHARVVATAPGYRLELISFRGAGGRTVGGYLSIPRRPGRHPGVVFLTGSGGSMLDFVPIALSFANQGGVGLSIQQPADPTTWAPLVVNARRALDLLASRSDVDPQRLGVAGLSLGAETAAIVAGVDSRPRVISLMSARGRPIVVHYLRYVHGDTFYVQNGLADEVIPRPQLMHTIRAIKALHAPLRVRWYPLGHTLDEGAYQDEVNWLSAALHAGRG